VKSAEEVRGLEEASYITDQCLKRLLEVARPGTTRRWLGAEMLKTYAELGGEDPIFLCMDGFARDGEARISWSRQDDAVLSPSDLFTFSFELIGPSGYWVELARMIVFAPPSEDKVAIHAAIVSAMEAAKVALRPGAAPEDVQGAIVSSADAAGTRLAWWSGHGIGQDVMEAPAIGREVMQDSSGAGRAGLTVAESMVFAIHPLLVPVLDGVAGYMADTYVVGAEEVRQLSKYPLDLLEVF
jgi:Xaa-Pro aminopeptidase